MRDEFRIEVRIVSPSGRQCAYSYTAPPMDIADLKPPRHPLPDFTDIAREQERRERLRRYTDLISADIAHAFTEYMLKDTGEFP